MDVGTCMYPVIKYIGQRLFDWVLTNDPYFYD